MWWEGLKNILRNRFLFLRNSAFESRSARPKLVIIPAMLLIAVTLVFDSLVERYDVSNENIVFNGEFSDGLAGWTATPEGVLLLEGASVVVLVAYPVSHGEGARIQARPDLLSRERGRSNPGTHQENQEKSTRDCGPEG